MWISKQEYDESGPSIVHRKYVLPASLCRDPMLTRRQVLLSVDVILIILIAVLFGYGVGYANIVGFEGIFVYRVS